MIKCTFTLDKETVDALERTAACLDKPKSLVVREAIRQYGERLDRLPDDERDRMLALFDKVTSDLPPRPRSEVEKELADVRQARRSGGRGSGKGERR